MVPKGNQKCFFYDNDFKNFLRFKRVVNHFGGNAALICLQSFDEVREINLNKNE